MLERATGGPLPRPTLEPPLGRPYRIEEFADLELVSVAVQSQSGRTDAGKETLDVGAQIFRLSP
jgi:hypothetical protein